MGGRLPGALAVIVIVCFASAEYANPWILGDQDRDFWAQVSSPEHSIRISTFWKQNNRLAEDGGPSAGMCVDFEQRIGASPEASGIAKDLVSKPCAESCNFVPRFAKIKDNRVGSGQWLDTFLWVIKVNDEYYCAHPTNLSTDARITVSVCRPEEQLQRWSRTASTDTTTVDAVNECGAGYIKLKHSQKMQAGKVGVGGTMEDHCLTVGGTDSMMNELYVTAKVLSDVSSYQGVPGATAVMKPCWKYSQNQCFKVQTGAPTCATDGGLNESPITPLPAPSTKGNTQPAQPAQPAQTAQPTSTAHPTPTSHPTPTALQR